METHNCASGAVLLSVILFLAIPHTVLLEHSDTIPEPKLPKECLMRYVYDPGDPQPFYMFSCLISNIKEGDTYPFLKGPRIKQIDIGFIGSCFSSSDVDFPDGVFSELPDLIFLAIIGCIKHHYTSKMFEGLHGLEELWIYMIRGPSFTPTFESDWLSPFKSLRVFNLSNGFVTSFPPETFCGLNHLKHLVLRNNTLNNTEALGLICIDQPHCKTCLPNVTHLDLSYNPLPILDLNFSEDMPNLETLLVNNSMLSELIGIDGETISGLVELDLSFNNLTSFIVSDIKRCNGSSLAKLRLENNHLVNLTLGLFSCTNNLKELNTSGNSLSTETLMAAGLNQLTKLEYLDLTNSNIPKLIMAMISNMTHLKKFSCSSCEIRSIEKDIFINLENLAMLDLSKNSLLDFEVRTGMPALIELNLKMNSFKSIPNFTGSWHQLRKLDLSGNDISVIEFGQLTVFGKLKFLQLASNNITTIFNYTFSSFPFLKSLGLSKNAIDNIEPKAFHFLNQLENLNIESNQIKMIGNVLKEIMLKRIDMHKNNILELGLTSRGTLPLAEWIDLSINNISHITMGWFFFMPHLKFVNLTFNRLYSLDQTSLISYPGVNPKVYLEGNFLQCNCHNEILRSKKLSIPFRKHVRATKAKTSDFHTDVASKDNKGSDSQSIVQISDADLLYCETTFSSEAVRVTRLPSSSFLCPYTVYGNGSCDCCHVGNYDCECCSICTDGCNCFRTADGSRTSVYCSGQNLTQVPSYFPRYIKEIYLDSNDIEILEKEAFSMEQVSLLERLNLQHNKIYLIEEDAFKSLSQLKYLWLHNNDLKSIDLAMFHPMTSLTQLTLHNNSWACDCKFGPSLKRFVQSKRNIISYPLDIICRNLNFTQHNSSILLYPDSRLLDVDFSYCRNLTYFSKETVKHSSIGLWSMAAIFLFIAGVTLVVYRNNLLIRVWAYNQFGTRCKKPEDNEDKTFDVFLAYAKDDEAFVIENVLPELEHGEMSYRVCLEGRDWPGGTFLTDTIIASVKQSKRTILLVSEHYFKSVWSQYEFQAAHYQVLDDRQIHLILILTDKNLKKRMESDMKLYLRIGTYLVYGEKFFWKKLRYYLADEPRGANDIDGDWIMLDVDRDRRYNNEAHEVYDLQ